MTATAWILIGIAVAISIAFPVALIAIAKLMGGGSQGAPDEGDG
jgi:hypothetical protein